MPLIDRIYRWIFSHLALILFAAVVICVLWYMLVPNIHYTGDRVKVARVYADFRQVREVMLSAERGTTGFIQLPADIFSPDGHSYSLVTTSGSLWIVSLGPDGLNDHGAIFYDATNGTQSRGDIATTIALSVRAAH